MTYRQWMAARHLLFEEFLGKFVRQSSHAKDAAEDAAFARNKALLAR